MITVPKIVLIILLIIAVWYAVRWFNRGGAASLVKRARQPTPEAGPRPKAAIEDLVACRACGAYVASGAPGCGRAGCPQLR